MRFSISGYGELDVEISSLIIAGWAGRNTEAVEHHIQELAELGVKRPSQVPCFYYLSSQLLTNSLKIQTLGKSASGEVEAVVIQTEQGLMLGVGSDHTDRIVEAYDVTVSKQMCSKPVSKELWPLAEVIGHWDSLEVRCWRQRGEQVELYQSGSLSSLLPLQVLIERCTGKTALPMGCAMFCGTQPVMGELGFGDAFEMSLMDPVLNREIRLRYSIESLESEHCST